MLRNSLFSLFVFCLFGLQASARTADTETAAADSLLQLAAVAYSESRFNDAAALYEQVLTDHGISAKVYYNLGNAYYKSGSVAPAILNYERALLLNPGDPDVRFNLELARSRIVDKIEPLAEFLLIRWYNKLGNKLDSNSWAYLSLGFFALFIACLFVYFFAKKRSLKKSSFFVGILVLFFSIFALLYSARQREAIIHPNKAIVFSESVTVKSSPDQSGTDLFLLHEGSALRIKSTLGDWCEIELEDGNVGWIELKHIEII